MIKKIFPLLLLLLFFQLTHAQNATPPAPVVTTRILFVFDASQSMYGRWQSDMKLHIAQRILGRVLDSLKGVDNLELALRLYGHQKPFPPQDCDDTRLEVPFAPNNIAEIKNRLSTINPKGTTPIAYALSESQYDFTPCTHCRNIIVLITDGIEECGGDPCEVSRMLQQQGITLKPFVIGIGTGFSESLDCVGNFYPVANEVDFNNALKVVIRQVLNATTTQVNLLDQAFRPTETNVNMTFQDHVSHKILYNFVHTFNNKGLPDTLALDPLVTYDITVHTIPPLRRDSIAIIAGRHNIIPFDAAQGVLSLQVGGNWQTLKNLQAIIRKHGSTETLNVQNFGNTQQYLTGVYDLEVLTLPRLYVDSVVISQSHTTTIEIPQPGILALRRYTDGYGSLLVERNNELELIYTLPQNKGQTENLLLLPGDYRIVNRSKWADKSFYTVEERFTIISGKTTEIRLTR
ncbi:MAG TPA: VWA domain-containing protein [Bacteroidales bacterium]|nr:VWA domain-containing protein [Bacteroidales bacterium]